MPRKANRKITESEFYMWRALFAISHADDVVSNEEIRFMMEAMEDIPFSPEQEIILKDDIKHKRDIVEMFEKISDIRDQAKFFQFARDVVHIDGDYGKAEQELLLKLKRAHLKRADVDQLIGQVELEFESEEAVPPPEKKPGKRKDILFSFRNRFLDGL